MNLSEVCEVKLDNGFKALLWPRRTLPVVASVLWYRVGARDERTGETGVSHFLEHMMFKGTDRFPKGSIDLLTSKSGGSNNAFTDSDSTAYYFAMASDRWETALEIEGSRMRNCLLDDKEFASEKSVVLEELAMGEDDPWRPLYQTAESLLFQVHPYHHPVIGYRQDLERLGVDGMRGYYRRSYGPNRAFLVVVGDIDVERTVARIRELFGSVPAVAEPRVDVLAEPKPTGERRAIMMTAHSVTRLCVAFPGVRMGEADDYALDIVAHALGINKTSRLYQRLVRREQLVSSLSVINEARMDPGGIYVLCELRPGAEPKRVEQVLREEIAALARDGIGKSDLERIRSQIRASFLFEDEAVLDTALKLGRFEALAPGGYRTLENVLPTYAALGNKDIKAAVAKYLDFDKAAVVWALPKAAGKADRAAKKDRRKHKGGRKAKARKGKRGSK